MTSRRTPGGLDLTDFTPAKPQEIRTPPAAVQDAARLAAEQSGFTSRTPQKPKIDGRSLRRTGRTVQINIKVTPETHLRFRNYVEQNGGIASGEALDMLLTIAANDLPG